MTNWKIIISGAVSAVVVACLLLVARGFAKPDPSATLSVKLDAVVADWIANQVPTNARIINLVIGDADAGENVLSLNRPKEEPTLLDRLKGAFGKAGDPRAVNISTPLTLAFGKNPGALTWTLAGFGKVQEKAIIEELVRNIVKAHDSEAVLNIVVQGEVGAAVLKSVKGLEGQVRGGVQVGVNSLVLLGMDSQSLKAYDPAYFSKVARPVNIGEWANIYGEGGMRLEESTIEMYSAKYDGAIISGRFLVGLLPPGGGGLSSSGLPIRLDVFASGFSGVFGREGGLESWVIQQQLLEEKQAQELRQREADELTRRRAEEEARRRVEEERLTRRRKEEGVRRRAEEEAGRRKADEERARLMRRAAIQWVTIPGGSFMMGSDSGAMNQKPRHRVAVRTFQMAKSEVTWGQYSACVEDGTCRQPRCSPAGDDHPVDCVDWEDAKVFSKWVGGRLPSEAEWEYAARSAGKDWTYPWGEEKATCSRAVIRDGVAGCGRNSTWPVCSKPAGNTTQGLCDMVGNAIEWTQDSYHSSYDGAPTDGSARDGQRDSVRVFRGGFWDSPVSEARAIKRWGCRNCPSGFRPSRSP